MFLLIWKVNISVLWHGSVAWLSVGSTAESQEHLCYGWVHIQDLTRVAMAQKDDMFL